MEGLPKAHIATNKGEQAAHGKHVDMVAHTSYGSHQVRVMKTKYGEHAFSANSGEYLGDGFSIDGKNFVLDDQHNISPAFGGTPEMTKVNLGHDVRSPDFCHNRDDYLMGNGQPDPRGTSMGGYNRR
jgi:hypothetical protein